MFKLNVVEIIFVFLQCVEIKFQSLVLERILNMSSINSCSKLKKKKKNERYFVAIVKLMLQLLFDSLK